MSGHCWAECKPGKMRDTRWNQKRTLDESASWKVTFGGVASEATQLAGTDWSVAFSASFPYALAFCGDIPSCLGTI